MQEIIRLEDVHHGMHHELLIVVDYLQYSPQVLGIRTKHYLHMSFSLAHQKTKRQINRQRQPKVKVRSCILFTAFSAVLFVIGLNIKVYSRNVSMSISPGQNVWKSGDVLATDLSMNSPDQKSNMEKELTRSCRKTYFWGGHKAGSTSLYWILTYFNDGEIGGFYNGKAIGKEPCNGTERWMKWVKLAHDNNVCRDVSSTSNKILPTHMLNGCPLLTSAISARKIVEFDKGDDPTFIMLIRDPVDRLVSHLNNDVRRQGKRMNIDQAAKDLAKLWANSEKNKRVTSNPYYYLSFQGLALKNLLSVVKDPKKVLIIPTESISFDTQKVVDAIMDHVSGDRWKVNSTKDNHIHKGTGNNHDYAFVSNETRDALRNVFREDVNLLEQLVGKRFPWSSWAKGSSNALDEEVIEDNSWIAATPNPQ